MSGPALRLLSQIGGGDVSGAISTLIFIAVLLLICFPVHEFAHAWVARRLGDDTAWWLGRVSLNPLKHLDPFGTLLFLLSGFGWAKPVPVNAARLRNGPREGMAIVAAAGPASNIALAVLFALVYRLLISAFTGSAAAASDGVRFVAQVIVSLTVSAVFTNIALAIFNLIPLPPLDGSRVLSMFLPPSAAGVMRAIEQYGFIILILVFNATPLADILISRPTLALAGLLLGS